MEPDAFESYRKTRFDTSLDWYNRHAKQARFWYVSFQTFVIVGAAAVPVLLSVDGLPVALSGGLGAAIAAVQGTVVLFRFHDNWINYRTAVHALTRELALYQTRAGPYATASDPEKLFVERVEADIATEWAESVESNTEAAQAPKVVVKP